VILLFKSCSTAQGVQLEKGEEGTTKAPAFKKEGFLGSIEAQAHNKTLRNAYLASLNNDNREAIANLETANPDEITLFNDAANGYKRGVLNSVDPVSRAAVEQDLNNKITSARIRVHGRGIQKQKNIANDDFRKNIDSSSNAAFRDMRNGEIESAAINLQESLATVDALEQSGGITSDKAAEMKRDFERETTEQGFLRGFDQLVEKEGFEAAFTELEKRSKKVPKGFTPDEWDTYIGRQRADLSRARSQEKAFRQEKSNEARDALKDYGTAVSLGFQIDDSEKTRVRNLVSGDEELNKQLNIINNTQAFSVLSEDDRRGILSVAETGQIEDVDQFAALTKANAQINKMAIEDGYTLGSQQGLIEPIIFDPSNPDTIIQKIEQAKGLSNHYGVKVSPLSDKEVSTLTNALPQMTSAEKIQLAMALKEAPQVWTQFAGKQSGSFAMTGATGDPDLMAVVFDGQEKIDAGLVKAVKPSEFSEDFADLVEGVWGTEDSKAILDSVKAYYASANKTDIYDSGDFEDAFNAVTGGTTKVNGFNVALPRGVDSDDFEDFIEDIQAETVEALGGVSGLSNERAAELIQAGRLRGVKSGGYVVEVDGQALWTDQNKPFVIDWNEDLALTNEAFRRSKARKAQARFKRGNR